MGEYYNWVNVDRKEYICPADFGYGAKRYESCHRDGAVLSALRNLLSKEWKGCKVFWMGDESPLPKKIDNELFSILKRDCDEAGYPGDMFDTVYETYKNVSGLFKVTEEHVKQEISWYIEDLIDGKMDLINEYGINPIDPFEGLFLRKGENYRYVINQTKGIGYSFETTKILWIDGKKSDFVDPLPFLLGYGNYYEPGKWIGDIIVVEDELPDGVSLIESIALNMKQIDKR